ncbi:MAG TPA: S53 family peptidase [Streptosporangiaceae bacterium]|nr:S53 family peptidase [Streptosporangiaceae bacterium]
MNKISLRRWRWLAVPLAACLTAACTSAAASAGPAVSRPASGSASAAASSAAASGAAPLNCAPPDVKLIPCFSPRAYEVAYGVAPLLSRGIDGHGATVVIPALAQVPEARGGPTDIRQDLATFDRTFGLPAARLQVVNTIARSATPYLTNDEEIEDTEMVHAIAPGATLAVVLVPANATDSTADFTADLTKVVQAAVARHAAVISISASAGEHLVTRAQAARMQAALVQAAQQHVTVVASSGDNGAISDDGPPVQVSLPASDPLVLAVGGTILGAASPGGAYHGEMAWNGGTDASAGGYSSLYPRPSYQDGVPRSDVTRGVPDVAASADHASGMALAFSDGSLRSAVGTSGSTPLWAGVIALADSAAGHPLGFVNPALYAIARGPAYHRAFHDVVTGDNSVVWPTGVFTGYDAGPGWDPVTGWGSPDAQYLVPLLARAALSQ